MPFLGSFAASFERRCAYSSAVIPGVAGERRLAASSAYGDYLIVSPTFARFQQMGMSLMQRLAELQLARGH